MNFDELEGLEINKLVAEALGLDISDFPDYSQDIESAFHFASTKVTRFVLFSPVPGKIDYWLCSCMKDEETFSVSAKAPIAPLAICRAVLKTLKQGN